MANLVKSNRAIAPWNDFFNVNDFFDSGLLSRWERDFPAVNISEDEKNYSVEVVAPGFKKEDFKLKVEDDVLTISAESKSEKKKMTKKRNIHGENIATALLPAVFVYLTM